MITFLLLLPSIGVNYERCRISDNRHSKEIHRTNWETLVTTKLLTLSDPPVANLTCLPLKGGKLILLIPISEFDITHSAITIIMQEYIILLSSLCNSYLCELTSDPIVSRWLVYRDNAEDNSAAVSNLSNRNEQRPLIQAVDIAILTHL